MSSIPIPAIVTLWRAHSWHTRAVSLARAELRLARLPIAVPARRDIGPDGAPG